MIKNQVHETNHLGPVWFSKTGMTGSRRSEHYSKRCMSAACPGTGEGKMAKRGHIAKGTVEEDRAIVAVREEKMELMAVL